MGATAFDNQPTSEQVRGFLGRAIAKAKADSPRPGTTKWWTGERRAVGVPKYIVCDRGPQFDCGGFRSWCRRKGIKPPRYGAIGRHGSIAVVERLILTTKCLLSRLLLVPYRHDAFLRELNSVVRWYNEHRPHTWLGGRTPNEVYRGHFPANRKPRFEPRPNWPRGSPCARPWALVRGSPGAKLVLEVSFHDGKRHLPIMNLRRVA